MSSCSCLAFPYLPLSSPGERPGSSKLWQMRSFAQVWNARRSLRKDQPSHREGHPTRRSAVFSWSFFFSLLDKIYIRWNPHILSLQFNSSWQSDTATWPTTCQDTDFCHLPEVASCLSPVSSPRGSHSSGLFFFFPLRLVLPVPELQRIEAKWLVTHSGCRSSLICIAEKYSII